jgi:hypothetical protein
MHRRSRAISELEQRRSADHMPFIDMLVKYGHGRNTAPKGARDEKEDRHHGDKYKYKDR